ncbi:MAG TPA: hypothetical protein PLL80_02965 [Candidatus Pacearchaeota archaeon]|nr:hypothetical protein [Candidatus Pacearchaeota archaeon]
MKKLPKNLPPRFPKPKKEESEFGMGKKDILICKECNAVYYYKSWHHRLDDYSYLKETKRLNFTLCPACQMIRNKKFEGEIVVENVSPKIKTNLKNLVKNFGEKAFERDPQDRVISFNEISQNEDGSSTIQILTTENQLAQRLAKKISEVFKGKYSISHSREESVIRAKVVLD